MMQQRIGQRVGSYVLARELDRGAYGIVYLAQHAQIHRLAAIKFMYTGVNSPEQQEQFRREAQILADLRHPCILPLLDFNFDAEGYPYLITAYAARDSLRKRMGQPLPVQEVLRMLSQVGRALHYVHLQGIIHRDLKPENILFDQDDHALLADFGIATLIQLRGTPSYMAPEQFKGRAYPQSDQYALACIAYELLTGQRVFTGDGLALMYQHVHDDPIPPSQHLPTLSPSVERAILTALAKEPQQRYSSVEDFLLALGIRRPAKTHFDLAQGDEPTAQMPGRQARADTSRTQRTPRSQNTAPTPTELALTAFAPPARFSRTEAAPTSTLPTSQNTGETSRERPTSLPPSDKREPLVTDTFPNKVEQQARPQRWLKALHVKHLFLAAGIAELVLLLIGYAFGLNPWAEAGLVLAVITSICGVAITQFVVPWAWMVLFLLLSPLAGGIYLFLLEFPFWLSAGTTAPLRPPVIDWHLCFGYFLLSPAAALLYGLVGPTQPASESIPDPLVKKLTAVLWFVGAALWLTGIGVPYIATLGLACMAASGFISLSQLIRLRHINWIILLGCSLFLFIFPLFLWGLAYGVFGPTEKHEETLFDSLL